MAKVYKNKKLMFYSDKWGKPFVRVELNKNKIVHYKLWGNGEIKGNIKIFIPEGCRSEYVEIIN